MKYLVSHQGHELGPFTLPEIVERVRSKDLDLLDYIYDKNQGDWVMLMEHPHVAAQLKSKKPSRPPELNLETPVVQSLDSKDNPHGIVEWFVLKGENRFGPFGYSELIKMLQQKVVFSFDFIWHVGMSDWMRVAEIDEFKPEAIRKLAQEQGQSDLFFKRQFKRYSFEGRVFVHDNFKLWQGSGFEISQGGVGLRLTNALVVPGQQLTVHFSRYGEWPSFNALCEVVSKKYVSDGSPVEYGLRFLSVSPEVQDEFKKRVA